MIKVATWSAEKNGADFFEIFRQMQADIFCVQDLELSKTQFIEFNPKG